MHRCYLKVGLLLVIAFRAMAQQPEEPLAELRKLGARESPGAVPVVYVESAEERALGYRKSLEAAHSWYQKQFHVQVPITLLVLDRETWEKFTRAQWPTPHNDPRYGLVVFPAQFEGFGAEAQLNGALPGERVLFHEAGHLFAHALKIDSGNKFMGEFFAQVLMAAYLRAQNPNLAWSETAVFNRPIPRYTTLADLDYLYSPGMTRMNYTWFQAHLLRLADSLIKGQQPLAVIKKLQIAFPAAEARWQTIEDITARLEEIRPGFKEMLGPLGGPTTIPRIAPSPCQESKKGRGSSQLVVQNETSDPLLLTFPGGRTVTIPIHGWRTYNVYAGLSLKLSDGTCLVARDEPAIVIIEKNSRP